jgi:hypothetical protein
VILRSESIVYPCHPTTLFDGLVAHFPDTDQQVLWADRLLGMISGVCNGRRHAYENPDRFTVYLRPTPSGDTVVTIHIEGAHEWGLPGFDPILALVAHVAGSVTMR